ncbi:hypothetical protein PoB_000943400, partial [Plakobranchus ocellatus]
RRQTYGQPLETSAETRIENKDLNSDDTLDNLFTDEDYYDFYDYFDSWGPEMSKQPLETTDETHSEDLAQNSNDFMSGLSSSQVSYYRAWVTKVFECCNLLDVCIFVNEIALEFEDFLR